MHTFSARLEECASRVGSKVKLAEQAGISFSQLMRYLNGSSKPTVPRLIALADAAAVTPGWLLSGDEIKIKKTGQIVLEKAIFLEVLRTVDRMLQNSQRQISSARKSVFIFALCKASEQLATLEQEFLLSERSLHEMLDFMTAYTDDELDEVYTAIESLPTERNPENIEKWSRLLARGHMQIYDTPSGARYFERMHDVDGPYAKELRAIINKAMAMNSKLKDVLDLGCGNGRHLKFIKKQYPELQLQGIDTSKNALKACKTLEMKGELPQGGIIEGDMRNLPYPDNSFDMIFSRYSLICFPLTPQPDIALHKVFSEVKRVLRPGGIFHGMTRRGQGISFYTAHQLLDVTDIQKIAQTHGFDIIGLRLGDTNVDLHAASADKVHATLSDYLSFQFIKPLADS